MTKNETLIKAFCAQFTRPISHCRTERINGQKVADAWTAAYWDQERGIGVTAVATGGQVRAYIEINRPEDTGEEIGKITAGALGMMKEEDSVEG